MTCAEYDRAMVSGLDGMTADTLRAYTALCRESDCIGWPEHYADDLHRHDRANLAGSNPPVFAWVLRDCGTHLYGPPTMDELERGARQVQDPMDWPNATRRTYGDASTDFLNPAKLARWYWWNGRMLVACSAEGAIGHLRKATKEIRYDGAPLAWRCDRWLQNCPLCLPGWEEEAHFQICPATRPYQLEPCPRCELLRSYRAGQVHPRHLPGYVPTNPAG